MFLMQLIICKVKFRTVYYYLLHKGDGENAIENKIFARPSMWMAEVWEPLLLTWTSTSELGRVKSDVMNGLRFLSFNEPLKL